MRGVGEVGGWGRGCRLHHPRMRREPVGAVCRCGVLLHWCGSACLGVLMGVLGQRDCKAGAAMGELATLVAVCSCLILIPMTNSACRRQAATDGQGSAIRYQWRVGG